MAEEEKNIVNLEHRCKMIKQDSAATNKERVNYKQELIRAQRVMSSAGVMLSELEQEKAKLMLDINKSVLLNTS